MDSFLIISGIDMLQYQRVGCGDGDGDDGGDDAGVGAAQMPLTAR
jgi:hypothetical protein